jgi:hypothetical protein
LLCAGVCLWTTAVFGACPRDTGNALPPRDELIALEQQLAQVAAECFGDPGYLAYRGAVLNGLSRPQEAAALLEQALMLEPDMPGAQLDYAEALAALGDTAAATAFIRHLLARPDVPPSLRSHLVRRLSVLNSLERFDALVGLRAWVGEDWRGAASVTAKAGYETNLNSAPSRDVLNLTIPGGEAVLLLAEPFRQRGGTAVVGEARGQLSRRLPGGAGLQFYGEVRTRLTPSASDTNYQQVQGVAAWSRPLTAGDALFGIGATHLHYGGESLYNAVRLTASRDWRLNGCEPRLGLETEWRHYPASKSLEGHFYGASTSVACRVGSNRVTAFLRAGVDSAQQDRSGGDQRQADLRFAWLGSLGSGSLLIDLVLSRQQDDSGFSPLFDDNAARRVRRATVFLEYAYPLAPDWSLVASFEGTRQRSNLALFDVSNRAIYLGLRWLTSR